MNTMNRESKEKLVAAEFPSGNSCIYCMTGNELEKLIKENIHDKNPRYILDDVLSYIKNPTKSKICGLYGLRRTGKTILMYHTIEYIIKNNLGKVAYISLNEYNSNKELHDTLLKLKNENYKYIFIDEITAVDGFIQTSSSLADIYAALGIHIVIAGTDSYAIKLASYSNLYDRIKMINTSFISFKEMHYLFSTISLLDYIKMGGTLRQDTFYDNTHTSKYISTSITDNIINSIRKLGNNREFNRLVELDNRGLLHKAIEQIIQDTNEKIMVTAITRLYSDPDLNQVLNQLSDTFDYKEKIDIDNIEFINEYIEQLVTILTELNVIYPYKRFVNTTEIDVSLILQPGIRYNQCMSIIQALEQDQTFKELEIDIQEILIERIIDNCEGHLIKQQVLINLLHHFEGTDTIVTQVNDKGKEYDIVIVNNGIIDIYEIKRSTKRVPEQYRWLINKDFNEHCEKLFRGKIQNRIVLYNGSSCDIKTDYGTVIKYKNVTRFLLSI